MSTTILAQAHQAEREQQQAQLRDWRQLIVDAISGKSRNDVASVLQRCGKSADDLKAAVENHQQRSAWKKVFSDGERANAIIQKASAEITRISTEANQKIEAIKRDAEKAMAEPRKALSDAERAVIAGSDAKAKLLETLPPETRAELEPIQCQIRQLMQQRSHVQEAYWHRNAAGSVTAAQRAQYQADLSGIEGRLTSLHIEIERIELKELRG